MGDTMSAFYQGEVVHWLWYICICSEGHERVLVITETYCVQNVRMLNHIVWCVISLPSANSWCTSGEIHGHMAKWSLSLPHQNHTYTLHTWTGSGEGRQMGNEGKNVKDRVRGRRGRGGWEIDDLMLHKGVTHKHKLTLLHHCCFLVSPL